MTPDLAALAPWLLLILNLGNFLLRRHGDVLSVVVNSVLKDLNCCQYLVHRNNGAYGGTNLGF
jgi:hypothetical protein